MLVGASLDPVAGTALVAASVLGPAAVIGRALGRTRGALVRETARRCRREGDLAVADLQLRRMTDRVSTLVDEQVDTAAELEATRRRLRRVSVELATSRATLSGTREDLLRARAALASAAAARDDVRSRLASARAEAASAVAAAARAQAALRRHHAVAAAPAPVVLPGQRSFASVDMRVFDAFLEADMSAEDAALDAPVRRGRHAADPVLDRKPTTSTAAPHPATTPTAPARDVA